MLCGIDELTRRAMAILVERRLNAMDVVEVPADLNIVRGVPAFRCRLPAPEGIIPRSGSIAPWASTPAVGASRSPTRTVVAGDHMR